MRRPRLATDLLTPAACLAFAGLWLFGAGALAQSGDQPAGQSEERGGAPSVSAQDAAPPGYEKGALTVDGMERTYLVHVPPSYDRKHGMPVLLMFHGGGGTAQGNERLTHISELSDKQRFILVSPEGLSKHWNDGRTLPGTQNHDDVGFIDHLIGELCQRWNIDKTRIYATGISNGGFFCQYLAIKLPEKIKAVASVAATLSESLYNSEKPSHPVPVLYILGTEDPLVPYQGGEIGGWLKRGRCVSAQQAIDFWVRADRCDPAPVETRLPQVLPDDGTYVTREQFKPGKGGAEVVAYIVHGGGHTWPGGKQYLPERIIGRTSRQINANEVIWQFFAQH